MAIRLVTDGQCAGSRCAKIFGWREAQPVKQAASAKMEINLPMTDSLLQAGRDSKSQSKSPLVLPPAIPDARAYLGPGDIIWRLILSAMRFMLMAEV